VWRALSNAEEFGAWFGVDLKGQTFVPGRRVRALNTGCGHENVWLDLVIERMEPQDLLSYRWTPYPIDPSADYTQEQPTLVTFTLEDTPDHGTRVTVVESGFDGVPQHRRSEAFRMHSQGWEAQLRNVARYAST
jgi:uncharacterized protein YndB with AHSA1/START domain